MNTRNDRWELRGFLKASKAKADQHPQVRREQDRADDTVEDEVQESAAPEPD